MIFHSTLHASTICQYICSGQPGSISGGHIAQLVEHLTRDLGGPGSNPGLVRCIFSLPVTHNTCIPYDYRLRYKSLF